VEINTHLANIGFYAETEPGIDIWFRLPIPLYGNY